MLESIWSVCTKNVHMRALLNLRTLYIEHGLWSNLKSLVGKIFETNAKMVLINDDQWGISDIVLDVWLFLKKINHPSVHQ